MKRDVQFVTDGRMSGDADESRAQCVIGLTSIVGKPAALSPPETGHILAWPGLPIDAPRATDIKTRFTSSGATRTESFPRCEDIEEDESVSNEKKGAKLTKLSRKRK